MHTLPLSLSLSLSNTHKHRPLLLGNNIPEMDKVALGVVTNKDAIAISQDSLGVQAQRVWTDTSAPSGPLDTRASALAVAARCDASRATQTWTHSTNGALMMTDVNGVDWCVQDVSCKGFFCRFLRLCVLRVCVGRHRFLRAGCKFILVSYSAFVFVVGVCVAIATLRIHTSCVINNGCARTFSRSMEPKRWEVGEHSPACRRGPPLSSRSTCHPHRPPRAIRTPAPPSLLPRGVIWCGTTRLVPRVPCLTHATWLLTGPRHRRRRGSKLNIPPPQRVLFFRSWLRIEPVSMTTTRWVVSPPAVTFVLISYRTRIKRCGQVPCRERSGRWRCSTGIRLPMRPSR